MSERLLLNDVVPLEVKVVYLHPELEIPDLSYFARDLSDGLSKLLPTRAAHRPQQPQALPARQGRDASSEVFCLEV